MGTGGAAYCNKCGHSNPMRARFCEACGAKQGEKAGAPAGQSSLGVGSRRRFGVALQRIPAVGLVTGRDIEVAVCGLADLAGVVAEAVALPGMSAEAREYSNRDLICMDMEKTYFHFAGLRGRITPAAAEVFLRIFKPLKLYVAHTPEELVQWAERFSHLFGADWQPPFFQYLETYDRREGFLETKPRACEFQLYLATLALKADGIPVSGGAKTLEELKAEVLGKVGNQPRQPMPSRNRLNDTPADTAAPVPLPSQIPAVHQLVASFYAAIEEPLEVCLDQEHSDMASRKLVWLDILTVFIRFKRASGASLAEGQLLAEVDMSLQSDDSHEDWDFKDFAEQINGLAKRDWDTTSLSTVMYLDNYDEAFGSDYAERARHFFLSLANLVIKADGKITPAEEAELRAFQRSMKKVPKATPLSAAASGSPKPPASPAEYQQRPLNDLLDELNGLIGLGKVKDDVAELANYIKVEQLRKSRGLKASGMSLHMVFYGNPGTGKTTVARLLAQIYRTLGVVSKGHLVETDRSGLVAGYVGQTALKVKEVVQKAIGGILFIDEAYALKRDESGQDFGDEAIETLLKLMEDNRDDLVVIAAGYPQEMGRFLHANPGLESRFNKFLDFEDYSPDQLFQIFKHFCGQSDYNLGLQAEGRIQAVLRAAYDSRDERFGNARLVRNLFEQATANLANRVICVPNVTEALLVTLEEQDIPELSKRVGAPDRPLTPDSTPA